MNGLEKLQQRIAGLERVQKHCPSRERAERIAHMRTGLRRFRDTLIRSDKLNTPLPVAPLS